MNKMLFVMAMCVAGASLAAAQMLLPGDGVGMDVKPRLVEGVVTSTNAPVVADTNALAGLMAGEKTLLGQAKDISIKITAISYPLRAYRQRMVAQDAELMAMSRAILEKEKELEAKLVEKYPDIAAKTKERDELNRQYSAVHAKIQEIRNRMDGIQEAIRKQESQKSAK